MLLQRAIVRLSGDAAASGTAATVFLVFLLIGLVAGPPRDEPTRTEQRVAEHCAGVELSRVNAEAMDLLTAQRWEPVGDRLIPPGCDAHR